MRLAGILVLIAVFLLLGAPGSVFSEVKGKAPELAGTDVEGNPVSLGSLKGKVVVVNFWATWCKVCAEEVQLLSEIHSKYAGKDVVVLGVSIDDASARTVKREMRKLDINYPVLIADEKIKKAYETPGPPIPKTFLIDRKGNIYKKYQGYAPEDKTLYEKDLSTLIGKSK
ncbi:MAG: TlpA family protein disulfide reductase [Armatimonadetes bacterium]|nr:TlpA family protein disulfide reductase [Armatimonadota bacterium]